MLKWQLQPVEKSKAHTRGEKKISRVKMSFSSLCNQMHEVSVIAVLLPVNFPCPVLQGTPFKFKQYVYGGFLGSCSHLSTRTYLTGIQDGTRKKNWNQKNNMIKKTHINWCLFPKRNKASSNIFEPCPNPCRVPCQLSGAPVILPLTTQEPAESARHSWDGNETKHFFPEFFKNSVHFG